MIFEDLTREVIGAAVEVHRHLGPGLFESVYEECLSHELALRGIPHRRQVELPIFYKDIEVSRGFRADIIVAERVVVELKAVDRIGGLHQTQLLTYMRAARTRVGFLINFNVPILKQGIIRRVL